jgi:fructosamine-3-kinase
MDTTTTPEQQVILQGIARDLHNGHRFASITDRLVAAGMEKDQAWKVVKQVDDALGEAKRAKAKKDILHGALWCGGGCIVTILTYAAASRNGGGGYMVAWGAIIFGAIQMIRGATAD